MKTTKYEFHICIIIFNFQCFIGKTNYFSCRSSSSSKTKRVNVRIRPLHNGQLHNDGYSYVVDSACYVVNIDLV
jgi:hypothetical protein